MRVAARFLLPILGCLAIASVARADWPMARHDPDRTGVATGTSNIRTPAVYWGAYLGGAVAANQAMRIDIAGQDAVVHVAGGRISAATVDGAPLWESGGLEIIRLDATADLDGDGALELVAHSVGQAFVLDLATGALRWSEARGEMGTLATVLVVDLDGDALDDVFVAECHCCQLNSGDTGYLYSFAGGVAAPERKWRAPSMFCGNVRSLTVDDLDGDGDADLVLGRDEDLQVLDGATGAVVATSDPLGAWAGYSWCEPVELTPAGGKELLCIHGTPLSPGTGHRMFALGYTAPGRLEELWRFDVGARDEDLGIGAGYLRDLDGDGRLEVLVSGHLANGGDVTYVVDGVDGTALATIVGETSIGSLPRPDGTALVLTRSTNLLVAYRFERGAGTPLQPLWSAKDHLPVLGHDWERGARLPRAAELVGRDVDGDGNPELITMNAGSPWELEALSILDGARVAGWTAASNSAVVAALGDDPGELSVSTSDGRVTTLAADLTPVASLRAGGYYDAGGWLHLPFAPVAGDLDADGDDDVLITDSRRTLLALDADGATHAGPPLRAWERARTIAPAIVAGLGEGGAAGIACRATDTAAVPPVEKVVALGPRGTTRWQRELAPQVFGDVVAGHLDGDAIPDVIAQWGALDDTAVRTTALAGSDGRVLWEAVTDAGPARFPSGFAVDDFDGDGVDDVIFHFYGTRVLSGVDGTEIAFGGPTDAAYFMPTLADLDGEGGADVTLSAGFNPSRSLSADLATTLWVADEDDRPYPYAAVTTCPTGPVVIGSALIEPSRLKVTLAGGVGAGSWQSVVLADGQRFLDQDAADAAGAVGGQLTSVHVHANLTGLGHPSAVVGSTDGWLYAIDPCTMTLDFAMPFGVPVGAVAFGDTDGDGLDEILVSAADGFLYGIKHAPLAAPGVVRDLDPDSGSLEDVDDVETLGTLAAAWDPVPGAIGYEVTVAHAEGGILLDPPWHAVTSTSIVFDDLPLEDGARYVISVRALSAEGPSPDRLSDGVRVHVPIVEMGDDGDSCGCCQTGGGGGAAAPFALVVLGLLVRRRRR